MSKVGICSSKFPSVKTGGIYRNRLCLSAFGGCFHPPVKTGGIEIGRIKGFYNVT
jgi:hypothetical protein